MLKGSLREFKTPDILQLIASQGKTGVLTIEHFNETISIGFKKGFIVAALKNKNNEAEKINSYILASQKIDRETYDNIIEEHKVSGIDIYELLIKEKILSENDIRDIIQFKIQEIMDNSMQWQEGTYNFQPHVAIYTDSKIKVSINTQGLILESIRRIDEWPRINKEFPDSRIVLKKVIDTINTDEVGPEENIIFNLIDNNRSIEDLIRLSGLGRFKTFSAIYNLYFMNLIDKLPRIKRKNKAKLSFDFSILLNIVKASIIIIIVILVDLGIRSITSSSIKNISFYDSPHTYSYRKRIIKNSLKIYFIDHEEYPNNLEKLVKSNLLNKTIIKDFIYKCNKTDYILE